jgi:hypothetical protein
MFSTAGAGAGMGKTGMGTFGGCSTSMETSANLLLSFLNTILVLNVMGISSPMLFKPPNPSISLVIPRE